MPYCQWCGHEVIEAAVMCVTCGRSLAADQPPAFHPAYIPPAPSVMQDPAMRIVIPVGVSGLAIAAGYAGLFALVGCGVPFALVLGILAYADLKKHPHKHGWGRTWFALGVSGLWIVGIFGLVLFGALFGDS